MRLDVFELVRDLREQRAQSVQTPEQYLYIYNVLMRWVLHERLFESNLCCNSI